VSDPSTQSQGPGWHADPSGRHQLRYWDGQAWTDSVSDNGQQFTDPLNAAPRYGAQRPRGPIGSTASAGTVILLSIVTLGIFVNPVVWFMIPIELKNLHEAEGEQSPVEPVIGLWFLLPIVGNFIWYLKMQEVINNFWIRRGAPPP